MLGQHASTPQVTRPSFFASPYLSQLPKIFFDLPGVSVLDFPSINSRSPSCSGPFICWYCLDTVRQICQLQSSS